MTKFIQEGAKAVTCSTSCSGRFRGGSRHWNRGDTVNKIRLENFRCFRAKQSVRLAPLTLLVGENSTGKTSFLALVRALWDTAYSGTTPDFKEAPYDLGSFDEIAHYRDGRAGRASEFKAGFDGFARNARRHRKVVGPDSGSHRFEVSFGRLGTAPIPVRMLFERNDATLTGHVADDMSQAIRFRTRNGEWVKTVEAQPYAMQEARPYWMARNFFPRWFQLEDAKPIADSPPFSQNDEERYLRLLGEFLAPSLAGRPFASAPVRSKPRRTYDPSRPGRDPEGDAIPMYLSTAFFEDAKSWGALREALEQFGREAGLFDEISVKPLGKRGGEPFQMQVRKFGRRAKGPLRNLVDVGYGVSQALPVITELFRDNKTPMFLLQQPEVHLHPSAQAALGSLFCQISDWRRQLVIETHSDHLVDRVRMDVRDKIGKLRPDDVSILFFEREDLDVRIHSLRLDAEGNIVGAPSGYRRFFMEESRRSLKL